MSVAYKNTKLRETLMNINEINKIEQLLNQNSKEIKYIMLLNNC